MAENLKDNSRKIKNNPPRALRTILSSLNKYRFLGVLTAVTILVEAAMQIEIPTVMSNLIDFGIMSRSQEAVQYYGLQLLIFAAIAMIAGVKLHDQERFIPSIYGKDRAQGEGDAS